MRKDRLFICITITVICLIFTATTFNGAFSVLWLSAAELWQSFCAYMFFLITLKLPQQTPVSAPSGDIPQILPDNPTEFVNDTKTYGQLLFDGNNLSAYLQSTNDIMILIMRLLPFFILFVFAIRQYIKNAFNKQNNDYDKDSRQLKVFKKISSVTYTPLKQYLSGLFADIRQTQFLQLWLLIWLFNFNLFAVMLSFFGIILYYFVSLSGTALYSFVYNTIDKLSPMFRFIPGWLWLLGVLFVIDYIRKQIALARLNHYENKNKGFILERSICTMLVGTMGKGKTTLVTDMALSTEAIFRHKAHELLIETDLKFPHFPYIVFENKLKNEIKAGRVFNLASAGDWVARKARRFDLAYDFCSYTTQKQITRILKNAVKRTVPEFVALNTLLPDRNLFGYDYRKYGLYYDDKKTMTYLFDLLKDYAKLYLIYITQSSLIISNYAVRTDFLKCDIGNFPDWNLDFFERDSKKLNKNSQHSHILDFDMLRLGKKLIDNNKYANCFEFGTIAITETGKERGNQFKSQELKETVANLRNTIKELEKAKIDATAEKDELHKLTDRATQLNDKFNDALKLIRHKCTISGFPFARVFLDEQRPESLGADARDLCEIVHIKDKTKTKLAMPFYFIGELLHALIFPKFTDKYQEYRFNRGDNTLLMYLYKKTGGGIHKAYNHIYNRFGYHIRHLAVEDGATGELLKEQKYYLSTKKIYSNRFSTDAYGDIFARGLRAVNVGIDDMPTYKNHKATESELKSQNSYFINEITKYGGNDE